MNDFSGPCHLHVTKDSLEKQLRLSKLPDICLTDFDEPTAPKNVQVFATASSVVSDKTASVH